MTRIIIAAVLILAQAGCAVSTYVPTSTTAFASYKGEITVLREMPPTGYIQLGSGFSEGGVLHSEDALIASLKRQAKKVGADTLVIVGEPQFHADRPWAHRSPKILNAIFLRSKAN